MADTGCVGAMSVSHHEKRHTATISLRLHGPMGVCSNASIYAHSFRAIISRAPGDDRIGGLTSVGGHEDAHIGKCIDMLINAIEHWVPSECPA